MASWPASVATIKNLFNDNWHCHVNPHISFVLKGGCSEKKKNKYERLPGRITFYQAGEPHQIIRMHHSIHIHPEMNDAFFLQSGFEAVTFEKTLHKTPDARFLMLQVYRELAADDTFSHASIQMLLFEYLSRAECWQEQKKMPEWLKKVHEAMNDRWSETLTLQDLSSIAGVHPVTVSAYFPRHFSCTFGAYMRKLKVERALELLKTPGTKLTDIAYSCGFFDQSHFTGLLKRSQVSCLHTITKYKCAIKGENNEPLKKKTSSLNLFFLLVAYVLICS